MDNTTATWVLRKRKIPAWCPLLGVFKWSDHGRLSRRQLTSLGIFVFYHAWHIMFFFLSFFSFFFSVALTVESPARLGRTATDKTVTDTQLRRRNGTSTLPQQLAKRDFLLVDKCFRIRVRLRLIKTCKKKKEKDSAFKIRFCFH